MRRFHGWLLAAGLGLLPRPGYTLELRIDPLQSHAEFSVRLFWLHTVRGRFEGVSGSLRSLSDGRFQVDARIAVDSLQMHSARIRRWVLAPEFFNAAQYPAIDFVSAPVSSAALQHGGPLEGELTLRGVRRPAHFELSPARCPDIAAGPCLIEARGQLMRSDFGMTGHPTALSNEVQLALLIRLEHIRR